MISTQWFTERLRPENYSRSGRTPKITNCGSASVVEDSLLAKSHNKLSLFKPPHGVFYEINYL